METETVTELHLGDIVVAKHHPAFRGTVIELRGPLGPNGEEVYRIRLGKRSGRGQVELLAKHVRLLHRPATAPPT